jgi:choline monooxygenase
VYNTKGELRGTPSFGDAEDFDKSDFPLYPVRVANYRGYLFVKVETDGRQTAEECTEVIEAEGPPTGACEDVNSFTQTHAAFLAYMREIDLAPFTKVYERKHVLECNWKVYVENYAEGYHIPMMHPSLNAQVDMANYKVVCKDGMMLHNTPIDPASASGGVWIFLAPTVAFNLYKSCMLIERVVPINPQRCEIRYIFLFKEDATEEEMKDTMDFSKLVTKEDIQICEAVQDNLKADQYTPGRLSPRHENGVHYFQSLVRAAMEPRA